MQITLMMAISLDGHITDSSGSTSWTRDGYEWERVSKECGNMVIGRATYEEIKNELFDGVTHFVLTGSPEVDSERVIFASSPDEIIKKAKAAGFDKLLLAGGGETNYAFGAASLIDELFIGVHPVLLGKGKNLFGKNGIELQLESLGRKDLKDGVIQLHYKVLK